MNDKPIIVKDPNCPFIVHVDGTAFNNPANLFPVTAKGKAAALKEANRKDGLCDRRVGAVYQLAYVYEWLTVNGVNTAGACLGILAVRSGDMGFRYQGPNFREYGKRDLRQSHCDARTAAERDADHAKAMAELGI